MTNSNDWIQLAKLLEAEWHGKHIDRHHTCELALRLMPHHPELRNTLNSVHRRLSNA